LAAAAAAAAAAVDVADNISSLIFVEGTISAVVNPLNASPKKQLSPFIHSSKFRNQDLTLTPTSTPTHSGLTSSSQQQSSS
jgi:hypothetical protein